MKTGYKTSEFWVTMAALAGVLLQSTIFPDMDVERTVAIVGAVAAYVLSRGWAKSRSDEVVVIPAMEAVQVAQAVPRVRAAADKNDEEGKG